MLVPACWRMLFLENSTISDAMSTSRIRDSDAVRFSWYVARLLSVCSRRFCTAPNPARASLTTWIASSIFEMSEPSAARVNAAVPIAVAMSVVSASIVSPSPAPTWKVMVASAPSRSMSLNFEFPAMRVISSFSWSTSSWIDVLSSVESVPFWYCTASSRVRCSMEWISFNEPSAVWTSDTASWVLRWAWPRPLTWPRSRSLIARPAASSAARLIREPDESFSIDFCSLLFVPTRLRWALNASMLLFTRRDMCVYLLDVRPERLPVALVSRGDRPPAPAAEARLSAAWTHARCAPGTRNGRPWGRPFTIRPPAGPASRRRHFWLVLPQQREDRLGRLVGLREHARAGLAEDVELGQLDHLGRHVHVADTGLGRGQVLLV